MKTGTKKALQYVLFLGIGTLLLYFTFKNVNPTELWSNIQSVDGGGLALALGIGFFAIILRSARWIQLLKSLGYEVALPRAIAAVSFSYLVNLVTPRVGEVARCTALNKTDDVPFDKLFGTVVLERLIDTLMFGVVVAVTIVLQADDLAAFLTQSGAALPNFDTAFFLTYGALALAGIALVYATRKIWKQWAFVQKILALIEGLLEGLKSVRKVKHKWLFWLYSLGIWTCYVGTIVVGFQIVDGLSDLGVGAAFYISVAAALGFVIPVPGGIGAYPYLVSKALTVLGYTPELGTAFATIIHSGQSLMFIVTGAIGMIYLYVARNK